MNAETTISVDAMGGDLGPKAVVEGIGFALKRWPERQTRYLLHGDEAALAPLLAQNPKVAAVCELRHTDTMVQMSDKPSEAVRRSRGSSMWNAVQSVKTGEADAVVSSGNTGALMAISKVILRMKKGIHRPAISANWPTPKGHTVVLDVGANVQCGATQLVEFAIMGEAYHRAVFGGEHPTVGLLNVGQEELKGNDIVREADGLIRNSGLDMAYQGFIEGNDISAGIIDVVVTDGFTGNIALKTAEGTARLVAGWVREALTSSFFAKLAAGLLALGALDRLKRRMDPRYINGGVLLGLKGIVVKSHGGADGEGFASALGLAQVMAKSDFMSQIRKNLDKFASFEEQDIAAAS
ncbi:phosphate acyltransferase PlsX [uncultured Maricaulis sp.]|uniref:phosphate acyltransferase PlsX n=1 Tax=uncultured Maricaulis sp. TaxID=174710 RepID=UPI0030D76C20|tara:strand:+ start:8033 stop:9088 length:1056 start_codon:yes stop_codon:yes gene_type:complete